MRKLIFNLLFFFFISISLASQQESDVFRCSNRTYDLLKQISESVCSRGEILLSVTTHQDLGWIDEVEKCVIMRDTLWLTPYLKRLREDPGFRMDIEQTSIIAEYLNRHPGKKAEIQKGLDEGRILIGATYIQPYEEMYSGESLIRQFYLGKKWLKANFNGYQSDTYYNSDVPGRTIQMPQILAGAGVKNMFISRHEKGLYEWLSPDGSGVTTFSPGHYIDFYNILGKEIGEGIELMAEDVLFWCGYFDETSEEIAIPAILNYEFIWDQKPVQNCDPFMIRWNSISVIENEKGERIRVTLPVFKYGNLNTCLNSIRKNSRKITRIMGERPAVWLYIHGPSHHYAISESRLADILLPDAEKFATINAIVEGNFRNYDVSRFNEAWEAKIYPDHGWGGKGGEITDRLFLSKFVKARNDATMLLNDALNRISSKIDFRQEGIPLIVFNGLNWKRDDPVAFRCSFKQGEAFGIEIVDPSYQKIGNQITGQQLHKDGSLKHATVSFIAPGIPSTGYKTFYIRPLKKTGKTAGTSFSHEFENRFFSVRFGKGGIERLFDKTIGEEIVDPSKFTLGEVFTMQSVGNGAGEFSDIQQPSMEGFDKTGFYETRWEKIYDGPVFTSFRYRQPVRHAVVEETITIYNQIKRIDIEIDIRNWDGILYREFRAAFPFKMNSPVITYEVPMGVVEIGKDELKGPAGQMYTTDCRLVHPRTLADWVNVSDNNFGATVSSGVIAFDYIDPTPDPASSLLIQPILLASRKSCHWEGNDYIQLGDHHFSFSLYIHEPGWENGFHSGKQGQNRLYSVLDPVKGAEKLLPEHQSFVSVTGGPVMLTALKKSEDDDGIVFRMTEMGGEERSVELEMFMPVSKLLKTNLIEEDGKDMGFSGKTIRLRLGKNAIETYKIK